MLLSKTVKKAEQACQQAQDMTKNLGALRQAINGRKGSVFIVGPVSEVTAWIQKSLEGGGFTVELAATLDDMKQRAGHEDFGYVVQISENGGTVR